MDKSAVWGDVRISLSDYEYKVLSLLCDNRCEVVEREQISALLGVDDGNMGDVYICHLRRKIDNKLGIKLIYTIRGRGYMLKN
jgi:DNA-binding response OmpR family regulator